MGGRIILLAGSVACLRNHPLGSDNHGTYRHLAACACGAGLLQGHIHMRAEIHALCMHRHCYLWQGAIKMVMGQA